VREVLNALWFVEPRNAMHPISLLHVHDFNVLLPRAARAFRVEKHIVNPPLHIRQRNSFFQAQRVHLTDRKREPESSTATIEIASFYLLSFVIASYTTMRVPGLPWKLQI
jgi:hypothetical protein